MKIYLSILWLLASSTLLVSQDNTLNSPCSEKEILSEELKYNPNAVQDLKNTEAFINSHLTGSLPGKSATAQYIIPVVLHVFHNGDDGKIGMDQVISGMEILNNDFTGLNHDWSTISPEFDSIKATLDIEFCLASFDPDGNPTTGVIYHEDSIAMLNEKNLFQFAWDNYRYLNIYLPKYTQGGPSIFTGYANFPSTPRSDNNTDGIFYSSIRWGYGEHSELDPGQEWASVITHEAGHWLSLRHTFENGCRIPGDYVADTPPTLGGTILLSGCDNNDFSCGVATNGENYMDYNHDCKKMFTQGQVDRMTAALHLPSRITLWSESNLMETGCLSTSTSNNSLAPKTFVSVYPNPTSGILNFTFTEQPEYLEILDLTGVKIYRTIINRKDIVINTHHFKKGLHIYNIIYKNQFISGKILFH